jgi:hypothetical protein
MRIRLTTHIIAIITGLFLLQGCTTHISKIFVESSQRPAEAAFFFEALDEAVERAGVRNASSVPVPGFPYLRSNRFLAGLEKQLKNEKQKEQWILWQQQLDLGARAKEIRTLPEDVFNTLARRLNIETERALLLDRLAFYSEKLRFHDQYLPNYYRAVQAAVHIPDEYVTGYRIVGLYPITSLPVAVVTHRVYDEIAGWHAMPAEQLETLGQLKSYGLPDALRYSEKEVHAIMQRSRQNVFGIPLPSSEDAMTLVRMFAPVFFQDEAADYDRIGEVVWQEERIDVNPNNPKVYYYYSHAFFKGETIFQINYSLWYPARDGPNAPRIERGLLDGLTVRISLDLDGRPFMVDIMNNCGCYHFFVPRKARVKRILPAPMAIDAFVPTWLPDSFPNERLAVRINSGWHQVNHVEAGVAPLDFRPYELISYDRLERLPHADQTYESIFNSKGIAKNTGRIEPLIFFPMGIPDVGSMRQRGHHAIKLVGRAHFDDPDLFDNNFIFE